MICPTREAQVGYVGDVGDGKREVAMVRVNDFLVVLGGVVRGRIMDWRGLSSW
jgi:hypothetical protein